MRHEILGVPVNVEAETPDARDAVERAVGGWRVRDADAGPPALTIRVSHEPSNRSWNEDDRHVGVNSGTLSICNRGGRGWAEPSERRAEAVIKHHASASMKEAALLIETLALYLVQTARRPVILHGAALVVGGQCVVVTGRDGVGKSTLSYACVREGFGLAAEDACFANQPSSPLQIWGAPWNLHLLPDSAARFPELRCRQPMQMLNGERKLRIPVAPERCALTAVVGGVVRLERTNGPSALVPVYDAADLANMLVMRGGADRCLAPAWDAARTLAAGPIVTLRFGSDIRRAIDLLRGWVESL